MIVCFFEAPSKMFLTDLLWPKDVIKIIVNINKTTKILDNLLNYCQFFFCVKL